MKFRKSVDEKMVRDVPNALRAVPGTLPRTEETNWEYKTILASRSADLNVYGRAGWELVSAIPQPADQAAYYFKRRK